MKGRNWKKRRMRKQTGSKNLNSGKAEEKILSHTIKGRLIGLGDWLWESNSPVRAAMNCSSLSDWGSYGKCVRNRSFPGRGCLGRRED